MRRQRQLTTRRLFSQQRIAPSPPDGQSMFPRLHGEIRRYPFSPFFLHHLTYGFISFQSSPEKNGKRRQITGESSVVWDTPTNNLFSSHVDLLPRNVLRVFNRYTTVNTYAIFLQMLYLIINLYSAAWEDIIMESTASAIFSGLSIPTIFTPLMRFPCFLVSLSKTHATDVLDKLVMESNCEVCMPAPQIPSLPV